MKILFVGDYSNFHVTLSDELRRRGHAVTLASEGSGIMATRRDVDLTRPSGLLGSFRYLAKVFDFISHAKGYDVVQIINPNFLSLRTGKLRYFFSELKRNNASVFLSVAGSDPVIVKGCCEDDRLDYSEYRIKGEPTPYARKFSYDERRWMAGNMGDHCRFIYENVDGAMAALYEYYRLARPYMGEKLVYTGIPVDTRLHTPEDLTPGHSYEGRDFTGRKINIFVGVKERYEMFKGLDRLYDAAIKVERRHPDICTVTKVIDLPYEEYIRELKKADIVVDQLYSYTPATNALETMSTGRVTVSGGEEEYYDFIGEKELRPVVNVTPYSDAGIVDALEAAVCDPERLKTLSRQGRAFVERHNDVRMVTDKFMEQWKSVLEKR